MNDDLYTAFDFINGKVQTKDMKFGWKLEIVSSEITSFPMLVLRYTMLNFDWTSLEWLGQEAMNLFLQSSAYSEMKRLQDEALKRYGRLYYDAYSVSELKLSAETYHLQVDIDRLLDSTVQKKAEINREKLKTKDISCA